MKAERFDAEITKNFNSAIAQLKYMGFISATRQNTYLFKKNIFGKPKYYSTSVEGEQLDMGKKEGILD